MEQGEKQKKTSRFPPGVSGNPKGRPPGKSFKSRIYEIIRDHVTDEEILANALAFLKTAREDQRSWQAQRYADWFYGPDLVEKVDAWMDRGEKYEKDLLAWRLRKHTFDSAQRILDSMEKLQIHMAGRRGGKTDTAARWLVEPLVTIEGARCLYMGLTLTKAMEQIWDVVLKLIDELGFRVEEKSRIEGRIRLSNGSLFQVAGNSSVDERSKQRGFKWHRVVIDECQSQKALPQLHDEIFGPTLLDYSGSLMFLGTGPRVRGTYWEELWTDIRSDGTRIGRGALRFNWNAGDNPFIPDNGHVLQKVREEHGWTETNPTYIREYLGQIAYDDDALVWRLNDSNYYTDDDIAKWITGQPVTDIRFSSGLDYGFEDADGLAIICYSTSRPESFLVYEYKARRSGVKEVAEAVRKGIEYVKTSPLFRSVTNKDFYVHADTGGAGKKISFDLSTVHHLPIQEAFKANKDMAVELLQDEVRRGLFKVRRGGAFDDEALKTVFARNDREELTRIIDDETYHPDVADAILYAKRPIQLFTRR